MHRKDIPTPLAGILLACILATGACQRHAPAPTSTQADPRAAASSASAAVPGAGTETTLAEPGVQPAGARPTVDFDNNAFAGTFAGTLPCADCPGIDETLLLDADGRFELTDVYRERPDSTNAVHGTWSMEAGGTRIRLHPDDKRGVDRSYAIDDHDTLTQLGMDGVRIDSGLNYSLKRGR